MITDESVIMALQKCRIYSNDGVVLRIHERYFTTNFKSALLVYWN